MKKITVKIVVVMMTFILANTIFINQHCYAIGSAIVNDGGGGQSEETKKEFEKNRTTTDNLKKDNESMVNNREI